MSAKQAALAMIERLPEQATFADIIDELYFRQKVEKGLQQLDSGQGIPHEEAVRRLDRWVK
jgi:predicted transcriptional regulator